MADKPNLKQALDTVMSLTYPPTTLTIAAAKAVGHRLAKPIVAKGNQPSRPVATVDGLAVLKADLIAAEDEQVQAPDPEPEPEDVVEPEPMEAPTPALVTPPASGADDTEDEVPAGDLENIADHHLDYEGDAELYESEAPEEGDAGGAGMVNLKLRPFPTSNRKEDALISGQAIPVPVGGEVPRGGEFIYPLSDVVEEPVEEPAPDEAAPSPPAEIEQNGNGGNGKNGENGENGDDEDDGPVKEPPRVWDLPARFTSGTVELKRFSRKPERHMIPIGAWARNRDVLIQEKTVLRPADMAMLQALGVEEVSIYRRPVVGVVSLGTPFPIAGKQQDKDAPVGVCPAGILVSNLARAARVAALPLGFAPPRYHELTAAVERWVQQVDILLLVGGSFHGTLCRGRDVVNTLGRVQLSGADINPGGNLTTGKVNGQPVVVLPGALPDVLAAFVLLVRPLLHKYLIPQQYEDHIELRLENGSRLRVERDTAVPVRYGFDRNAAVFTTRYSGRPAEDWLDYIRGQALLVLEGGRSYSDGEVVTAHRY